MRRNDRQIKDGARIDEIVRSCAICRLGLCDGNVPYIIPLNFGYEYLDAKRVFYFHGASCGRKIDLIRRLGIAGFELDCGYVPVSAKTACGHSSKYASVIGHGKIHIVTDPKEREYGMLSIMGHMTGSRSWELPPASMKNVAIIRLDVEEISCKENT